MKSGSASIDTPRRCAPHHRRASSFHYRYPAAATPLVILPELDVLPAIERVTDGARTRDLLSRATIRCDSLQCVLGRPVIGLIYGVLAALGRHACPLCTGLYQPGCSTVAVNNTLPHVDPEPVPGTHRLIVCALSGPGLCGILYTHPRALQGAWPRSCSGSPPRRFGSVRTGAMQDLSYGLPR